MTLVDGDHWHFFEKRTAQDGGSPGRYIMALVSDMRDMRAWHVLNHLENQLLVGGRL